MKAEYNHWRNITYPRAGIEPAMSGLSIKLLKPIH